jgi:hypothetical protein
MDDTAISELLSFFDFAHLPPHLAAASEPFYFAAHALEALGADGDAYLADLATDTPGNEGAEARRKIALAVAYLHSDAATMSGCIAHVLRLLLEAKDCAVRAALVRHRAKQAAREDATRAVLGAAAGPDARFVYQETANPDGTTEQTYALVEPGPGVHFAAAKPHLLVGERLAKASIPATTETIAAFLEGWAARMAAEPARLIVAPDVYDEIDRQHQAILRGEANTPAPFITSRSVTVHVPPNVNPRTLGGVTWSAKVRVTDPTIADTLTNGDRLSIGLDRLAREPATAETAEGFAAAVAERRDTMRITSGEHSVDLPVLPDEPIFTGHIVLETAAGRDVLATITAEASDGSQDALGHHAAMLVAAERAMEPPHIDEVREILATWQANAPGSPSDYETLLAVCRALGGVGEYDQDAYLAPPDGFHITYSAGRWMPGGPGGQVGGVWLYEDLAVAEARLLAEQNRRQALAME